MMNSIGWPRMFNNSNTVIKKDNDATLICLHLLLSSEANTFNFDPDFGIKIRRYYFNQNNYVLKNILIDEIYTKMCAFAPQIFLERNNILIKQEGSKLYAEIYCKNRETFENNIYNLVLFQSDEGE